MSNDKYAYGWSGHILVSSDEMDSDLRANVVAIPPDVFKALLKAYGDCKLDERIEVQRLGITSEHTIFLAAGSSFSEGYANYGTVFQRAELQWSGRDAGYLQAMQEIYGLELPPCRLMVGCSSEH